MGDRNSQRSKRVLALLAVPLLLTACATPIGVKRVDARKVHRSLTASVLTTGEPSPTSLQALNRSDLTERFERDPAGVLALLHADYVADPYAGRLLPLAELSFVHAENAGGRPYFLAAAIYAYAFLFPGPGGEAPDAFDPGLRLAADLYNRGLTGGLASDDRETVDLSPRSLPLPFGRLEVGADADDFYWVNHRLENFLPVAEFEIRGLRDRYRRPGIGAPLAAHLGEIDPVKGESLDERWLPPRIRVACTAFLRIASVRQAIASGEVSGTLELYVADADPVVSVDGRRVPAEYEPSAALAYALTETRLWDLELTGFLGEDVDIASRRNLVMLRPHERGRIPLVMIHGTASSPARWAEMINELRSDPRLNRRYEVWIFFYKTGNPILYSAAQLRQELTEAVAALDPDGTDPGLQRMVLMGHSQGGLLTRLQATESGDRFWRNVSDYSIEDLDLDPEVDALLRSALYFEAVPQVRRVIFISTPHRGSFLALNRLAGFVSNLVTLPLTLVQTGAALFDDGIQAKLVRRVDKMPSSVDNMTPGNPFLVSLNEAPLAGGVVAHSIVAVLNEGPPEGQNDGVVAYESAHADFTVSERVVISGHSVQGHPDAIAEVQRILHEHLDGP